MVTAYLLMGALLLKLIAQRRVTSAFKQMERIPAGLTALRQLVECLIERG